MKILLTILLIAVASIAVADESIWMSIKWSEYEALKDNTAPYFRKMYGDEFILEEAGWTYPEDWDTYTKPEQRAMIDDYLSTNETYYSWIYTGWQPNYVLASDTNEEYAVVAYWKEFSLERRAKSSKKKLGDAQPDVVTNITAELLAIIESAIAKNPTKSFKINFDKSHVTAGLVEKQQEQP